MLPRKKPTPAEILEAAMLRCPACGELRRPDQFRGKGNPRRRTLTCLECRNSKLKAPRGITKPKVFCRVVVEGAPMECPDCGEMKPRGYFYNSRGHRTQVCADCRESQLAQWRPAPQFKMPSRPWGELKFEGVNAYSPEILADYGAAVVGGV